MRGELTVMDILSIEDKANLFDLRISVKSAVTTREMKKYYREMEDIIDKAIDRYLAKQDAK